MSQMFFVDFLFSRGRKIKMSKRSWLASISVLVSQDVKTPKLKENFLAINVIGFGYASSEIFDLKLVS